MPLTPASAGVRRLKRRRRASKSQKCLSRRREYGEAARTEVERGPRKMPRSPGVSRGEAAQTPPKGIFCVNQKHLSRRREYGEAARTEVERGPRKMPRSPGVSRGEAAQTPPKGIFCVNQKHLSRRREYGEAARTEVERGPRKMPRSPGVSRGEAAQTPPKGIFWGQRAALRAWSKSAMMSSMFSMPTESRMRSGLTPAAICSASES